MSQFPFDPYLTPVDFALVNGKRSPGIGKITGLADKRKFDVQTSMYTSGGIVIYRGREPSRFVLTMTLATAQDWIDWATWRIVINRPIGNAFPKAMTFVHPWTAMLDVTEVVVEEIGQPEEEDETGSWHVAVKFLEFRRVKPSLAVPDAAKTEEDNDPDTLRLKETMQRVANDQAKLAKLQQESH